ncbi:MAG: DNA gyrase inhibitor YacG [Salaquimonas sp.]
MCAKPAVQAFRPFCSKRCADLDLAKWFNGAYSVPSTDPEDIEAVESALQDEAASEGRSEKPH